VARISSRADTLSPVSRAEGERLRSLAAMARALVRSGGVVDVVERAITEGCRVVDADSGSVSVLDRPAGLVRVLVNVGDLSPLEERRPRDETYQMSHFPKLSLVVGELKAWTCSRDDVDPDPNELALLEDLDKGASMGAPVVVDGDLWGELYLTRHVDRPAFDDADLAYVEALAAILASGVSRAVRETRLTELAYQDPLTGLANRRRLDQVAAAMIPARSDVVVVSIDVNDLKPVNDRHGHDAGDRLLQAVGHALGAVATSLPGSLAARTGGDEFCLIVPTGDVAAVGAAVRQFADHVVGLPHAPGVSCGIASTSGRIGTPRVLFAAADRAMYYAKKNRLAGPYSVTVPEA
jgi:diguanylate cyclase (GGDEF)-like protein